MLTSMTRRLPRMSRSSRVLPSGIIEEIAPEMSRQSSRKTPAQREAREAQREAQRKAREAQRKARARTRASRPKEPSPEAQQFIREIKQLHEDIKNYSKQAEILKAQSHANALAVMETVEEAQAQLDRIEEKKVVRDLENIENIENLKELKNKNIITNYL